MPLVLIVAKQKLEKIKKRRAKRDRAPGLKALHCQHHGKKLAASASSEYPLQWSWVRVRRVEGNVAMIVGVGMANGVVLMQVPLSSGEASGFCQVCSRGW